VIEKAVIQLKESTSSASLVTNERNKILGNKEKYNKYRAKSGNR